jgi:hypothetical protein
MSKQVYIVKNSEGQVIGARQSARPYTHALIVNDCRVESYSSSETGARRAAAISKFVQYTDEAFKASTHVAVVPVECIGEAQPVTLTAEGHSLKVKTFHAYKFAVVDLDTGKLSHNGRPADALFYRHDLALMYAQRRACTHTSFGNELIITRRNCAVVALIDPRANG